ncbi:MAG: hypothetical protein LBJ47_10350 [Tannerella sp.]|nr:hypothetical protein [Tannerella sp.]
MIISKWKYTFCPDRNKKTGRPCPVRDRMSVEKTGGLSDAVPSGTECGDCHIAYLTAREKWVAANFSTNILSRRDRKTRRPCPGGTNLRPTFCPLTGQSSTNILSLTEQKNHYMLFISRY